MRIEDYQALALRTEKPLPTVNDRLEHAHLGLVTETGEIATVVKRMAIYGKSLDDLEKDGKTTLRAHIVEELGDSFWYLPIAADAVGFDIGTVLIETAPRRSLAPLPALIRELSAAIGDFSGLVDMAFGGQDVIEDVQNQLVFIAQPLVDIAAVIEMPLSQVLADNIAKLQARYPEKYSDEAAEARADKGGLDARSS